MKKTAAFLLAVLLLLAAASAEPVRISISCGGDCTIGCTQEQTGYSSGFKTAVEKYGYEAFFRNLLPVFGTDDLTLVNLEGPFTDSKDKRQKKYNFKAPAEYVEILTAGSVEAVNIANNHSKDYGDRGYLDTMATLDGAGIVYSGNGTTAVYEVKGVKIGMTGYDIFTNGKKDISADVKALREAGCAIVIASFHWGVEYDKKQNAEQAEVGRAAIDAGADVVIGHHPHVIQGIECYKGKYILYSLGNLVFGGNTDPSDRDTYLARLVFNVEDGKADMAGLQLIPARLTAKEKNTDYTPVLAEGKQAEKITQRILSISKNLPD